MTRSPNWLELIGQGDPYAERSARRSADEAAPGFDWAANEDYADEGRSARKNTTRRRRFRRLLIPLMPTTSRITRTSPRLAVVIFLARPGSSMVSALMPVHTKRTSRRRFHPPANCRHFMSAAPVGPYEARRTGPRARGRRRLRRLCRRVLRRAGQASPARRLVVMMAVLGLVIVGTAGAFAYRNMFGGAVFAGLPPIIKASITPNKILPKNGDAQADNSAQSGTSAQANSDKLVSHEEQPVNMEPPKVGSRVVATIPIGAGQMPPPLVAAAPAPAAPDGSAPSYSTASAGTALVPPPDGGQPAPSPMPTTAAAPPAAPAPAAAPSEPKKVHTVLIHADQSTAAQPAAPAPAPAPRSTRSAAAKASASCRSGSGRC